MKTKSVAMLVAGLSAGGQERHMSNLANEFSEMGIDVHIVCFFKTKQFWELHPNIKVSFPEHTREGSNKFLYALKIIPHIRKSIKASNPDVIMSFGEWFNPFSVMSTLGLKKPVFLLDLMGPAVKYNAVIRLLRKTFYPLAKGVIVQTTTAKEIVQSKIRKKGISIVPNPLNEKNIPSGIEKKKQIITVGRLSKEKGHSVLLKGFANVKHSDWSLHIVGDGNLREELEALAKELKIEDRTVFHGYQTEFDQLLGESQIFVLPSFYEGFPNALIEAMSVPLACVASNCIAGPSDIINEGSNGYLFPPGDDDKLTERLNYLIENPSKISSTAKDAYKIREELNARKIAQRYLDVITLEG